MQTNFTRNDVISSMILYDYKLTVNKKLFVMNVLDKHGVAEALYALYTVMFNLKDEKELLTFKF